MLRFTFCSTLQCDQTGRNPAHLGGFQHFWAGKIFDGAVGGLGGLLHKMRKWRNFFTKIARIFGWGGQFGRNLDLYGRFRWKTSGHSADVILPRNFRGENEKKFNFRVARMCEIPPICALFGPLCAWKIVDVRWCGFWLKCAWFG